MEAFRICKEAYSQKLTSSGSANRWNLKGQRVIYTGSSRSLSTLELIVHKGAIEPITLYKMMVISLADDDSLFRQIHTGELPSNWRTLAAYAVLQKIGANWYNKQESLILKVPSAVISYEHNYIVNTEHPAFEANVQLVRVEEYFWDSRLL